MTDFVVEETAFGWQYGLVLANGMVVFNATKFETQAQAEAGARRAAERVNR